ncbi:glutathione S-transferase [Neisseria chenwenguii]|uniref:Glutathione S-transferase n=1 Tax=Neisseria chenwenguii TaxID=1853278 RepID=A0A220S4G9_9NEIS|nr:glutathione S-transferase [Neisseria chenwenguii]ROV56449.1 glutathione S-transferase family protein [Neisseria chenwenguii]
MKFYYFPGACAFVSQVALEWTGAEFEAVAVERDRLKEPEFLALNPVGSVPVLQDGDWVLTQNMAILDYLDTLYPEAGLFGRGDTKARAKARQWLAFANSDVHATLRSVFAPNRFIEGEGEAAQIRARATLRVLEQLGVADRALENQDYLAGEKTVADVYFYLFLRWAVMLKIDVSALKNLAALSQRMDADAGVQKVLKQQGLA